MDSPQRASGISVGVINATMSGAIKTSKMVILIIPELEDNPNGTYAWTGRSVIQFKGIPVSNPFSAVREILQHAVNGIEAP